MLNNYINFLNKVFSQIHKLSIDVSDLEIDHIAYTANSSEEYEKLKLELLKLGKMVGEDTIKGRRISVIKLHRILPYQSRTIPGLELIEPTIDKPTPSGLDHIEFVVPTGLSLFKDKYPDVNWNLESFGRAEYPHLKIYGVPVKFHELNIFDTITQQRTNKS